jgi:hypothetical protein
MCLKCQFHPSNERHENVAKMFWNSDSLCFKKVDGEIGLNEIGLVEIGLRFRTEKK